MDIIDFEIENPVEVAEPEIVYQVNRELNLAWKIIEDTGCNLFLTGRAGTGKTTFLKKLREKSDKRMVVLAPTGVAAINANGSTLHSFFQLPFSLYLPGRGFISEENKYFKINNHKKRLIASLSLLVIDEISMVRPDQLDAIDSILRKLRNSSQPFGGIQLLLIGDLRQLPPVVKEEEWEILQEHYSSPYFFESHALKKAGYLAIELSTVYRQSDELFLNMLNQIRQGYIEKELLTLLNTRVKKSEEITDIDGYIRLTTHNKRADIINNNRLESLKGEEMLYEAEVKGTFPESAYPAESVLRLKEGAQVMFTKNDAGGERRYYNGLIGTVVFLSKNKIHVKVPGKKEIIEVEKTEWVNTQYKIDEKSLEIKQEEIGKYRQYPLQLAWSITIHKSQGLTFDKAIIDATYSFAPGQTYVALSRCRSLDGLILESPIRLKSIIIDKEVNAFVADCDANLPDEREIEFLKDQYVITVLKELFDFEAIKRYYDDFMRLAFVHLVSTSPNLEVAIDEFNIKIKESLCNVSRKFTNIFIDRNQMTRLINQDKDILERIRKGCIYFYNILKDLKNFLISLPIKQKNQKITKRLNSIMDSLDDVIVNKSYILMALSKLDFSVKTYQQVKTKAVINSKNGI